MLCGFRGLPSSEGTGFSRCWRQWYQTWWTNRLIQYGNSSASCVFQTGFCVHMPEWWFFACSGRSSCVETGGIITLAEFVCACAYVSRERQTSNSWLLLFAFSILDLTQCRILLLWHSFQHFIQCYLKCPGFWLFQFVLRVKERLRGQVFVLISLTKFQVQEKPHQHFSRLQTWHLSLFFSISALRLRNLQY